MVPYPLLKHQDARWGNRRGKIYTQARGSFLTPCEHTLKDVPWLSSNEDSCERHSMSRDVMGYKHSIGDPRSQRVWPLPVAECGSFHTDHPGMCASYKGNFKVDTTSNLYLKRGGHPFHPSTQKLQTMKTSAGRILFLFTRKDQCVLTTLTRTFHHCCWVQWLTR